MNPRTLLIVTGMSGAGKSNVIRALEDGGFYCVDNLPLDLFPKFLELIEGAGEELGPSLALGLDLRETALDQRFPQIYDLLKRSRLHVRILFVEASDSVLLQRFSETRRPHPLAPKGSVEEGVRLERARLELIRERADKILDTTNLNVHQLRSSVLSDIENMSSKKELTVNVVSFGFSFGLPPEASLVFDVRFLPNPHFVPELRPLTGEDSSVFSCVCESADGTEFLSALLIFLKYLLPKYKQEGKAYLTIAVGCTGGRHRSVAVARWLFNALAGEQGIALNLIHRDRAKHSA